MQAPCPVQQKINFSQVDKQNNRFNKSLDEFFIELIRSPYPIE